MMPLVNLLPWRQIKRQQRVKREGVLLALVLLLIPLLVTIGWQAPAAEIRRQQLQNEYLKNTDGAFQHLYQQRLALQQQTEKRLRVQRIHDEQQQAILVWQARLIQLASGLPTGTWLSSLTLQKGIAVVKGNATALEQMQALEKQLTQLDGVSGVQAGAVQRQEQSGFGFAFTLTLSEVANALAN